jgi:uncharacterized membrane protein YccC
MADEQTTEDTWGEIGRQFQVLGESLAAAFRTAWESEENREHLKDMRTGLEAMVNQVGQALQDASTSPEMQRARAEVEKAAESTRVAGEHALREARPHLQSALRQASDELRRMAQHLEQEESFCEVPADESAPGEP